MRSHIWNNGIALVVPLLIGMLSPAADASSNRAAATTEIVRQMIKKRAGSVQLVTFPDTNWSPVKVVRGKALAKSSDARKPEVEKVETAETITFNGSRHSSVRVIRGESDRAVMVPGQPPRAGGMNLQVVSFADPRERPVKHLAGLRIASAGFRPVRTGLGCRPRSCRLCGRRRGIQPRRRSEDVARRTEWTSGSDAGHLGRSH